MNSDLPYRLGVGIMLINPASHVFVGQRLDNSLEAWQMPQGGIDEGEDPFDAALRELEEETGIHNRHTELIAESSDWYKYDLPEQLIGKMWKGKYRGQKQKWYALNFTGNERNINIKTSEPEFRSWKWAKPQELPEIIVPFKRKLYQDLVQEFSEILGIK
jgi:putative (di)nucleoside polyphosphate hydrolase